MIPEAQKGKPFYALKEDIGCVGPLYLGMLEKGEPVLESGWLGAKMQLTGEMRVNRQLYDVIARLPVGRVKYVAFAPLDQLPFDPDLLIVTADLVQAETLLRATNWSSLKMWKSERPFAIECNSVYIQPFLTGEVFYNIVFPVGFALGRIRPGTIVISFPYQFLPTLVHNLREMPLEELAMDALAHKNLPKFKKKVQEIINEGAEAIGVKAEQRFGP
jgi:uncharacterized protein (DUF169 family)